MEEKTPKAATREQRLADQVDELKALQVKQMAAHDGDQTAIKTIKANLDPKYEVKDYERDYVHILLTQRVNNEATKSYIDETRVMKLHPNNLEQMISTGIFGGYDDAKVIHDPRTGKNKKEIKLKAEPVPQVAPVKIDDSALAAKEQKLAEREKRLAEQEARLDAKLEKLEGKGSQAETLPDFDADDQQERTAPARSHKKK